MPVSENELEIKGDKDCVLTGSYCWITVGNMSVKIYREGEGHEQVAGVRVVVWPIGKEDECPHGEMFIQE